MNKNTWVLFFLGIVLVGVALALASGLIARKAKLGDTITFYYTLRLDDGSVYGTNVGSQPLQVTLGEGKLVSGFEEAIIGMQAGESKTVTIPPDKAYGPYRPELVEVVERSLLPKGVEAVVGQQLEAYGTEGKPFMVTIIEVNDTTVTADINPPLAGQNLTFDIELLTIGENTAAINHNNLMKLSWILFASGVFTLGFVLFRHKDSSGPFLERRSVRLRSTYH